MEKYKTAFVAYMDRTWDAAPPDSKRERQINIGVMKNVRFMKTTDMLAVINSIDHSARVVEHVKRFVYESSAACTCCPDFVIDMRGYLLYTTLSNKELRALGVKTNSPKDFYGCY